LGGYCLTELTDVPHELNGILDLNRRPKRIAVEEVKRGNQGVLPILTLDSLVVIAGRSLLATVHISNDGPQLEDLQLEVWFGDAPGPVRTSRFEIPLLQANRATKVGEVMLPAPLVPGGHDLIVSLRRGAHLVSQNRYPVHVVEEPHASGPFRVLGHGQLRAAFEEIGAVEADAGPTVVEEGQLDLNIRDIIGDRLASGEVVVVLAQPEAAAASYPLQVELTRLETAWGSSIFRFTTDEGWIPSLPRRNVLVAEDSTIHAMTVISRIEGQRFPSTPLAIAYKPAPSALTGTLIGAHKVGPGLLILCQYRLAERASYGDPAAKAVLADLLRWAMDPTPALIQEHIRKDDGRSLTYFWVASREVH
ncbi:MAG: hypothetical protein M3164_06555, partial [Actinomycetota bacterium]|nr:hypothetical protein [Actinomycetota bacterium]